MRSFREAERLALETLHQAERIPGTLYPIPLREDPSKTTPCFRNKETREKTSIEVASHLFRANSAAEVTLVYLRAYVTACHNPKGEGLTEMVHAGLRKGPTLPPDSLFAPLNDSIGEIITGLGRTLLKLKHQYDLVLPRTVPTHREVMASKAVLIEHVERLAKEDLDHARSYVLHLSKRLAKIVQ